MNIPTEQLYILYNEACRQRAIDTYNRAIAFDPKAAREVLSKLEKVHGPYTEGFYEQEEAALRKALGKG
jgi:hypothetical protein